MEAIASAFSNLADPVYWFAVLAACFLAIAVGIIPGVGSLLVMAMMLPFVVLNIESAAIAIVMLATITGANNTLDSIPAVLVGLPSGSTQVTFLEGHQLARQGQGDYTLGAVYGVSMLGGLFGALILAALIPVIRPFVLRFGEAEIAMMAFFGVAMVAVLSFGAMTKGIIAGLFGIILGFVGTDPLTGTQRFVFDQANLWTGLPIIATVLGVFAIPEMIDLCMTRSSVAPTGTRVSPRNVFRGFRYGVSRWKLAARQSGFGVLVGAIPGVGSGVIDWLAYAFGISLAKDRRQFGHGSLEGVLFAESAQNAKEAGQAVPSLALGIPGGTPWILVITAMLFYGLIPGPSMLGRHADVTILLIITLAISNAIVAGVGLVATGWVAKLTQIPYPVIGYVIIPVAFLSAFLDMTYWLAIPIILVFTGVGFIMKWFRWPRPPLVLGFILGPIIDANLRSAISIHGGLAGVVARPLTVALFIVAIAFAAILYAAMARATRQVSVTAGVQPGMAPGLGDEDDTPRPSAFYRSLRQMLTLRRKWTVTWKVEHLVALGVVLAAAAFLWGTLDWRPSARAIPYWICLSALVLAVVQLLTQMFQPADRVQGEIMDLGMRTTALRKNLWVPAFVAFTFVLFLGLALVFGLKWASVAMAAAGPLALMRGRRQRVLGSVLAAAAVAVFIFFFMDYVLGVIWPRPAFWHWV